MIAVALGFCGACYGLALVLNLIRLLKGPDAPDRILALDTMVVNGIVLIVLYGLYLRSAVSFEAALLLAMTGFVSSVAYCRFLLRGNVIE